MNQQIGPSLLTGTVRAMASKSAVHRLLICAALADKPTVIENFSSSKDIEATIRCLQALGARISADGDVCRVEPPREIPKDPVLDCGESGSTLRFLLPVATLLSLNASFCGSGRLPDRPISDLVMAIKQSGVDFSSPRLPFRTTGILRPGRFRLPGNVSSQYVSGLLLALSAARGDSLITLSTPLESKGYVDMTLDALKTFGADFAVDGSTVYRIHSTGRLKSPGIVRAEGDWSNAAPFLCAGAVNGPVSVSGLNPDSLQGDRKIMEILARFGADCAWTADDTVTVSYGRLYGIDIDLKDIPDLLPPLAVLASFAQGSTRFVNGARLRLKESDRLAVTADMIRLLGGTSEILGDELRVQGRGLPCGGSVPSFNDHRIVMSVSLAAAFGKEPTVIENAEAIEKSYPDFFRDYNALGGVSHVV